MTSAPPASGGPHPVAAIAGVALAALAILPCLATDTGSLLLGELLTGVLAALPILVGALVGGGKTGRMAIATFLLPGAAFGRRARRSGLAHALATEMGQLTRAWVASATLIAGAVLLLAKPVFAPVVSVETIYHADPRNPMAPSKREIARITMEYFQGAHRSFVIAGAVLVVLGLLVLLIRPRP